MKLNLIAFMLISLVVPPACNSKKSEDGKSQGLVGTSWSGSFRHKNEGGKLGEAESIQFHFFSDLTFNLVLVDNLSVAVSGTYKDMPINKRLVLDIDKSTYDDFAKKGDTKIFTYALENNELILNDDESEYLLSRESDEEDEQQTALEGDWDCRSEDGTRWLFNINDQEFRASKSKADFKTVYFEGEVAVINSTAGEELARLEIKSSNVKDLVGTILRARLENDVMIMEEVDKKDEADPNTAISCNR